MIIVIPFFFLTLTYTAERISMHMSSPIGSTSTQMLSSDVFHVGTSSAGSVTIPDVASRNRQLSKFHTTLLKETDAN